MFWCAGQCVGCRNTLCHVCAVCWNVLQCVAMCLIHMWHDSFTFVTWLMFMCDMLHFVLATCIIDMCVVTRWYVWHDSFICFDAQGPTSCTWMSHVAHMSESCHTHESARPCVRRRNTSCHTYKWVMPRARMSHVTHMNESCCTHEWVMSHTWMRTALPGAQEYVMSHI